MMRGAHCAAVAVRNSDGEIVVHETALSRRLYRGRIIRTPFVRGVVGLWDALGLGTRALMWAADVAVSDEEDVDFNGPIGWATIALSPLAGHGALLPAADSGRRRHWQPAGPDAGRFGADRLRGLPRQPDRRRHPDLPADRLHLGHRAHPGREAPLRLPWRRAQDYQRLGSGRGAAAGGRGQLSHRASALWHGLPVDGRLRQRVRLLAAGASALALADPLARGADTLDGRHRLRGDSVLGAQLSQSPGCACWYSRTWRCST